MEGRTVDALLDLLLLSLSCWSSSPHSECWDTMADASQSTRDTSNCRKLTGSSEASTGSTKLSWKVLSHSEPLDVGLSPPSICARRSKNIQLGSIRFAIGSWVQAPSLLYDPRSRHGPRPEV